MQHDITGTSSPEAYREPVVGKSIRDWAIVWREDDDSSVDVLSVHKAYVLTPEWLRAGGCDDWVREQHNALLPSVCQDIEKQMLATGISQRAIDGAMVQIFEHPLDVEEFKRRRWAA